MNLEAKKQNLLATLGNVRERIGQLNQELAQRQAQENQVLGALMLCDELMAENSENSEQQKAPVNIDQG